MKTGGGSGRAGAGRRGAGRGASGGSGGTAGAARSTRSAPALARSGWLTPLADRRTLLILVGILIAGALLRGFYLAEFVHYPDFTVPHVDADFHNYWARGLAFDQWTPPHGEPDPLIRTTPYFRPPGYPYYLAALYKLTGPGYVGPRIVQMLLGLVNVFLAFLLGARLRGRIAGLVFAAMMATYWIFIFFEGEFQEPVLMILLVLLLAMVLMDWTRQRTWRRAALAGALVGLAGLIRPNALLVLPVIALWMLWVYRRRERPLPWRPAIKAIVAAGIATFLVILPATLRNLIVAHDFVLISSNGGINLYIGNNNRADGIVRGALPEIGVLDTCYDWPEIVSNVERKVGRPMSHSQVSDYFSKGATNWMLHHPLGVAELAWKKTLLFWGPAEPQDNKEVDEDRRFSHTLRAIPWNFPLALAIGLAGAGRLWMERRRRGNGGATADRSGPAALTSTSESAFEIAVLLGLIALIWWISYLPFAITSRYRVPVIPVLLFFGSVLVVDLARYVSARRWRDAGVWGGAAIALFFVAGINFAGYESSPARWHYQRGMAYNARGKAQEAVREFEAAVKANPNYVAVYNDLGATLASNGRVAESIPYFQQSVRLNPNNAAAHANLGAALELTGRLREAGAEYQETLRLRPGHPRAMEGLRRVQEALAKGASGATAPAASSSSSGARASAAPAGGR
ncbi:MAG: tetratricopeptide repeat protein [Candidatus Eisenbacteria bacterium]